MTFDRNKFCESPAVLLEKIQVGISTLQKYADQNTKEFKNQEPLQYILDVLKKAYSGIKELNLESELYQIKLELVRAIDDILQTKKSLKRKYTNALIDVYNELTQPKYIQPSEFLPTKPTLNKKAIQWQAVSRICFRGDDRDPEADEIFRKGFLPKKKGKKIIDAPFKSNMDNIVACSTRFRAAILFPWNADKKYTWVYVFKTGKIFDVHAHGYHVYAEQGLGTDDAYGLFVDELITQQVLPQDIIAAVQIRRDEYQRFFQPPAETPKYLDLPPAQQTVDDASFIKLFAACGEYIILSYKMNPHCDPDEAEKNNVEEFIKQEIEANRKMVSQEKINEYLMKNLLLWAEQDVRNQDVMDFINHKPVSKAARKVLEQGVREYKKSVQCVFLPLPTSGYHRNHLFSQTSNPTTGSTNSIKSSTQSEVRESKTDKQELTYSPQ